MRAERVVSSAGLTSFLRDPRPRDAGNQGPTSVRPQAEAPPSAVFGEPTTIPYHHQYLVTVLCGTVGGRGILNIQSHYELTPRICPPRICPPL